MDGIKPGRPPGKIKKHILKAVREGDFDPWLQLLKEAETNPDPVIRFQALKECVKYIKPALKSMDVTIAPITIQSQQGQEVLDLVKTVFRSLRSERK